MGNIHVAYDLIVSMSDQLLTCENFNHWVSLKPHFKQIFSLTGYKQLDERTHSIGKPDAPNNDQAEMKQI